MKFGDKATRPYTTPKVLNKEYLPEKPLFNTFGVGRRATVSPRCTQGYQDQTPSGQKTFILIL